MTKNAVGDIMTKHKDPYRHELLAFAAAYIGAVLLGIAILVRVGL